MSSLIPQIRRPSAVSISESRHHASASFRELAWFICRLILIAFLMATAAVAQISRDEDRPRRNPDEPQVSAARRAADAAVAFSPEIIIDTLRH